MRLSPYLQTGQFRKLVVLFIPIALMTFSSCLFLFIEKVLLARFSTAAMEAAVNAAYAIQIFQGPCIALVMMSQVYVGRLFGSSEWKNIGPGIWQFIWFSFFSMLVIVPCSLLYGYFYFKGTDIESTVSSYFYVLVSISFFYPMGAALSCFYLGRGKTRLILFITLSSQVVKLILAYLFIFGWGWIPSLGLLGGAISTVIAQGGFVISLLICFLNAKNAANYASHSWHFQKKLFWECIHPGLLRAGNRILNFTCWASIAHLMIAKGSDFLLVLSIGGTLSILLSFLGDAICQAQTTSISHMLGRKDIPSMHKAFISGSLLSLIAVFVTAIPLLLFPTETFAYLFPKITLDPPMISQVFFGSWLCSAFYTWGFVPISYVLAFKDMKFSLFMGCFSWINGYFLMYFSVKIVEISADQFWTTLAIMHATNSLCYLWRTRVLLRQATQVELLSSQA